MIRRSHLPVVPKAANYCIVIWHILIFAGHVSGETVRGAPIRDDIDRTHPGTGRTSAVSYPSTSLVLISALVSLSNNVLSGLAAGSLPPLGIHSGPGTDRYARAPAHTPSLSAAHRLELEQAPHHE
jgi:hypothetical protein